jgi:hypothetical protein
VCALLITLLLLFHHTNISSADRKFYPINRLDLDKIISMHHPNTRLVKAIITVESQWNYLAESSRGAIGLMQVLPSSGKIYTGFSREELFCPEKNIIAGTTILKHYQRTSSTLHMALIKYSGGAKGYYGKVMREMKI